jgi:hypothetical protein
MNIIEDERPMTKTQKIKKVKELILEILYDAGISVHQSLFDDIMGDFKANQNLDSFLSKTPEEQKVIILSSASNLSMNYDEIFKDHIFKVLGNRKLVEHTYKNFIQYLYSLGFKNLAEMIEFFEYDIPKLKKYLKDSVIERPVKRLKPHEHQEEQDNEALEARLRGVFANQHYKGFIEYMRQNNYTINMLLQLSEEEIRNAYMNYCTDNGIKPIFRYRGGKLKKNL